MIMIVMIIMMIITIMMMVIKMAMNKKNKDECQHGGPSNSNCGSIGDQTGNGISIRGAQMLHREV